MRNLIVTFLLLLVVAPVFSQDLIVTAKGDSINCKITKYKSDFVYFTFKHNNEIRNTLIATSDVKGHWYNYYGESELSVSNVAAYQDYQKWRFAIGGGYSYLTAKVSGSVPQDFKAYVKELKSGYHFYGDVTYFVSEPIGFGLKYSLFKSSNSLDNIYIQDSDGNIRYGRMSDEVSVPFIGPSFTSRYYDRNKKNVLYFNYAIGYMGYKVDKVVIDKYYLTGSTLGLIIDVGYDLEVSKNQHLGFQLSLVGGSLSQYKISDGRSTETIKFQKGEYESLSRIDLSVGFRFGK